MKVPALAAKPSLAHAQSRPTSPIAWPQNSWRPQVARRICLASTCSSCFLTTTTSGPTCPTGTTTTSTATTAKTTATTTSTTTSWFCVGSRGRRGGRGPSFEVLVSDSRARGFGSEGSFSSHRGLGNQYLDHWQALKRAVELQQPRGQQLHRLRNEDDCRHDDGETHARPRSNRPAIARSTAMA